MKRGAARAAQNPEFVLKINSAETVSSSPGRICKLGNSRSRTDSVNIVAAGIRARRCAGSTPASEKEKVAKAGVPHELPVGQAEVWG